MAHYRKARWPGEPGAHLRVARAGGWYEAFCPDPVAGLDPLLNTAATNAVVEAERTVHMLQERASGIRGLESLARVLLRGESVASSRIEGLQVGQRRLARAVFDPDVRDETAREVVSNIEAMDLAVQRALAVAKLGVDDLVAMHRTLLGDSRFAHIAGEVRTTQNWIGGNAWNPIGAEYVPPPPELLPELLDDLVSFLRRDDVSPVVQAAVAHAQFELIHPFADGNGRVGRCLIHVVLVRRRLAKHFVPPVSLVLAANPRTYIAGLTAFRSGQPEHWISGFAEAMAIAATQARQLADDLDAQQQRWLNSAGNPRAGSTTRKVIESLAATPILDIATAQRRHGVSHEAARLALHRLAEAGVLRELSTSRYRRAWAASEVFDLADTLERRLAVPLSDMGAGASAQPLRQRRRRTGGPLGTHAGRR
jgi:Fic family protein